MSESSEPKPDLTSGIPLARIPEGCLVAGLVGDEAVVLTRFEGEIRAFGGTCTHLGAPLEKGLCADGTLRCPWHHARFDLRTGEAVAAPAFDALSRWVVEVSGDWVMVRRRAPESRASHSRPEVQGQPGIVIVGGGAAGYAAAHQLRRSGYEGGVTMVSADCDPPYDRTLLTKDYLDGSFGAPRLPIARTTLDELGVAFMGATVARSIDPAARVLILEDGRRLPYSKLLLSTGAEPNRLDVPGAGRPHVRLLRSLADCRALLALLTPGAKVVVVGSSFIGLEAAASIRSRGFEVTVVTPEAEPMEKILGRDLARAILSTHTAKGVVFRTRGEVKAIENGAVHLEDGSTLPAEVVLVGIGVKPRAALAEAAGLRVRDGVVVDRYMRTSDDDIYAAGDIARWPDARSGASIRVEHWVVAERQGQIAARNMIGEATPFTDIPFFWSKHFDFSFRYVGHADEWDEAQIEGDLEGKKAVIRYRKKGEILAVATVEQDPDALQVERDMEAGAVRS